MTNDEREELLRDSSSLAYTAIRFSGLYKELSSAEWDGLASMLAPKIVAHIEELIEQQRQQMDAFVAKFRDAE